MARESVEQRHVELLRRVLEKAEERSCYRQTLVRTTLLYVPRDHFFSVNDEMYHNGEGLCNPHEVLTFLVVAKFK